MISGSVHSGQKGTFKRRSKRTTSPLVLSSCPVTGAPPLYGFILSRSPPLWGPGGFDSRPGRGGWAAGRAAWKPVESAPGTEDSLGVLLVDLLTGAWITRCSSIPWAVHMFSPYCSDWKWELRSTSSEDHSISILIMLICSLLR